MPMNLRRTSKMSENTQVAILVMDYTYEGCMVDIDMFTLRSHLIEHWTQILPLMDHVQSSEA